MSAIESNLSKKALFWTKAQMVNNFSRESLSLSAPKMNQLIYEDCIDTPLNQLPVEAEKALLNKWYIKHMPARLARRLIGADSYAAIFPGRELDTRRNLALTADAAPKIREFITENLQPQLEAFSNANAKFENSWLPPIVKQFQAGKMVTREVIQAIIQPGFLEKANTFIKSILHSPKEIEVQLIQNLQDRLHLLKPTNWKALQLGSHQEFNEASKALKPLRGKLLKEAKQAIQQLKLNETEDIAKFTSAFASKIKDSPAPSIQTIKQAMLDTATEIPVTDANAELSKLAVNSLRKGQTDTIQLLKEGGADPVQIGQELVSYKLGFPLPKI